MVGGGGGITPVLDQNVLVFIDPCLELPARCTFVSSWNGEVATVELVTDPVLVS